MTVAQTKILHDKDGLSLFYENLKKKFTHFAEICPIYLYTYILYNSYYIKYHNKQTNNVSNINSDIICNSTITSVPGHGFCCIPFDVVEQQVSPDKPDISYLVE